MGYVIKTMSDDKVRQISNGQVTNFGRYNFKFKHPKPYDDGLFCQKTFGPTRDYTCDCGIEKKVSVSHDFKSEKCPTCGIEYLPAAARHNRFGHIELHTHYVNPIAYPIVANILGINDKILKALSLGKTKISIQAANHGKLLTAEGESYIIVMLGDDGDIGSISQLVDKMRELRIDGNISMMQNRSNIAQKYFQAGYSLYDMFNTTVLVSPCGGRDLKKIGDRIGYGEVNVLYTRLMRESLRVQAIHQENEGRISDEDKREMIKYESLMIQKLINMMYLDGADYGSVKIEPIMESLRGKTGIVRGNLLGKRVDFSGRSVITSGPELPIDHVGLPVDMLHELMKPYIIRELITRIMDEDGVTTTFQAMRAAGKEHSHKTERVIQIIEKLSKSSMVIMNRAPSLHRYSAMTFKIKPHFGECIYFPPMACSPFNADFDGDTLAVHLLLSEEAYEETKITSFENNLMSSAAFDTPNAVPAHEMIVGAYLLSNTLGV